MSEAIDEEMQHNLQQDGELIADDREQKVASSFSAASDDGLDWVIRSFVHLVSMAM